MSAELQKTEPAQPDGLLQKLRQQSVRFAGRSFIFADISLFLSGLMSGKLKEASAGIFGLTAGAVGSRYGNPKLEKQMEILHRDLGNYLEKNNVAIPASPDTAALTKKGGLIENVETFLYEHPTQVMNAFYSLIGVQFIRSALQHNKRE